MSRTKTQRYAVCVLGGYVYALGKNDGGLYWKTLKSSMLPGVDMDKYDWKNKPKCSLFLSKDLVYFAGEIDASDAVSDLQSMSTKYAVNHAVKQSKIEVIGNKPTLFGVFKLPGFEIMTQSQI